MLRAPSGHSSCTGSSSYRRIPQNDRPRVPHDVLTKSSTHSCCRLHPRVVGSIHTAPTKPQQTKDFPLVLVPKTKSCPQLKGRLVLVGSGMNGVHPHSFTLNLALSPPTVTFSNGSPKTLRCILSILSEMNSASPIARSTKCCLARLGP